MGRRAYFCSSSTVRQFRVVVGEAVVSEFAERDRQLGPADAVGEVQVDLTVAPPNVAGAYRAWSNASSVAFGSAPFEN